MTEAQKEASKRGPGTSLRLPASIDRLWTDTARKIGQNKTATIIEAIRLLAKQEGVPMREEEGKGND